MDYANPSEWTKYWTKKKNKKKGKKKKDNVLTRKGACICVYS